MVNDIKKFCETDSGTNLLTQAEYLADAQRLIGNQPGIARDKLVNKVLRQTSYMTSAFADYLVQQTGLDILDDDDTSGLLAIISSTFATGLPVGSVINMLTSTVPLGFIKANGAAISRTTYSSLFNELVTVPGFTSNTFTVTIASPAVVTKSAHGFLGGERLRLSTTGFLPTGLDTSTDYFVKYIDANTFNLQTFTDVIAGTMVNTSASQGGVQSYQRSLWGLGDGTTTFNVPDLRGAFSRAWDDGRGLDASRVIASLQRDAIQNHVHNRNQGNTSENYTYTTPGAAAASTAGSNATAQAQSQTGLVTTGGGTTPRISTETRPINYAIMPVIKY